MFLTYAIFQVKDEKTREYGFMGLDMMKRLNLKVDSNNYKCAWHGMIDNKMIDLEHETICEKLFHEFNVNHPEGYKGRSMSVSDVIAFTDIKTGKSFYYYCDSVGFKKLKKF